MNHAQWFVHQLQRGLIIWLHPNCMQPITKAEICHLWLDSCRNAQSAN